MIAIRLAVLLALCACSRSDHWAMDRIETGDKDFDSSKLAYRSPDPLRGIDLEFIRTKEALRLFIAVHSQPVPASVENPKEAKVWLTVGEKREVFSAARHEGGQRLLLPDLLCDAIVSALKAGKTVTLSLQGYTSKIEPKEFSAHFKKLDKPPLFSPSLLKARLI